MDEEEKELVQGIANCAQNSLDWIKVVDRNYFSKWKQSSNKKERKLAYELKSETENLSNIVDYAYEVYKGNEGLNRQKLKKMVKVERNGEQIADLLYEKYESGELELAGVKGLIHLEKLETLTEDLILYEDVQSNINDEKVRKYTDGLQKFETDHMKYMIYWDPKGSSRAPVNKNFYKLADFLVLDCANSMYLDNGFSYHDFKEQQGNPRAKYGTRIDQSRIIDFNDRKSTKDVHLLDLPRKNIEEVEDYAERVMGIVTSSTALNSKIAGGPVRTVIDNYTGIESYLKSEGIQMFEPFMNQIMNEIGNNEFIDMLALSEIGLADEREALLSAMVQSSNVLGGLGQLLKVTHWTDLFAADTLRMAIQAEKMERYLAGGYHQKNSVNGKPSVYCTLNFDEDFLPFFLEFYEARRVVIDLHRKSDFKLIRDTEYLDDWRGLSFQGRGWENSRYDYRVVEDIPEFSLHTGKIRESGPSNNSGIISKISGLI